jgi:hypothetical protein
VDTLGLTITAITAISVFIIYFYYHNNNYNVTVIFEAAVHHTRLLGGAARKLGNSYLGVYLRVKPMPRPFSPGLNSKPINDLSIRVKLRHLVDVNK